MSADDAGRITHRSLSVRILVKNSVMPAFDDPLATRPAGRREFQRKTSASVMTVTAWLTISRHSTRTVELDDALQTRIRNIQAMANLMQRPANSTMSPVEGSVEFPPAANTSGVFTHTTVLRDDISVRDLAPANDNPLAATDAAPSISPLLWLDLVEVEGHVLLAANFDGDIDALRATSCRRSIRDLERAVNTIYLDQLFDTEKFIMDDLRAFGEVICESLRTRAARAFPGRRFVADVVSVGKTGRVGVRLYQDKHRKSDA